MLFFQLNNNKLNYSYYVQKFAFKVVKEETSISFSKMYMLWSEQWGNSSRQERCSKENSMVWFSTLHWTFFVHKWHLIQPCWTLFLNTQTTTQDFENYGLFSPYHIKWKFQTRIWKITLDVEVVWSNYNFLKTKEQFLG